MGLEKPIEEHLSDSRRGLNKQFTVTDLLGQSVYSRLAGYEDLNDAERLAADPTFRSDQLAEDLGPGRGADLDLALVRDRAADKGRESAWAVGTPLISLESALVKNSLCRGQERRTMRESAVQIGNSG